VLPISIELWNFQSYKHAKMEFDFQSALILGEVDDNPDISNGCGKSTIFEAIAWALFGKTRQASADGVVKRGYDYCEVDFFFYHDGKKYHINRKRNARFSRMEVTFFEVREDGEHPIDGDTNREIDEHIRNHIRSNYDVFINSSYFMQKSISDFMAGSTSDRQKLIGSVLDLERWNKYGKEANTRAAEAEKIIEKLEFKLKSLQNVETDIISTEKELRSAKEKSVDLNNFYERLNEEISELERRLASVKSQESSLNDYHDVVGKLDNTVARIDDLLASEKEKAGEVESLASKIASNNDAVEQVNRKIEEISVNLHIKNQIDVTAIEKKHAEFKTKHGWLLTQIAKWQGDKLCPCCSKPWHLHPEKLAEYTAHVDESKVLEVELSKIDEKLKAARIAIEKIKQTEVEIEKYTSRRKTLENGTEINILKRDVAERDLETIRKNLATERAKEKDLRERVKGLESISASTAFDDLHNMLKSKRLERETTIITKNDMAYTVGGLSQKLVQLEANKEEKQQLAGEANDAKRQAAVFSALVRVFGRNGIQAVIIDNVVEELTKATNAWLNEFSYGSTYVKFVTQKKDTKGSWKEALDIEIVTPSGACEFESLSGGEAFRVAFAIRLAISQIQARRMGGETQLLMLDEVSSSLDRHGLETFISIIRKLEKSIKVMVVTHDDNLKDKFDNIVKVRKSGNDSELSIE
jgi:DNA repair protein SbcC/Rad50